MACGLLYILVNAFAKSQIYTDNLIPARMNTGETVAGIHLFQKPIKTMKGGSGCAKKERH